MGNEVIIAAKQGKKSAVIQVLQHFESEITYQAWRHLNNHHDPFYDDFVQEGRIAVLEAIRKTDLDRGGFSSFVKINIRNAMVEFRYKTTGIPYHHVAYLRSYLQEKAKLETEKGYELDEEEVLAQMNVWPHIKDRIRGLLLYNKIRLGEHEVIDRQIEKEISDQEEEYRESDPDAREELLRGLIELLPRQRREMVRQWFYHGKSQGEIARSMGITRENVNASFNQAKKNLRREWPQRLFLWALESGHFFDIEHTFPDERWRIMNGDWKYEYRISNYGRVISPPNHENRSASFVRKPVVIRQDQFIKRYCYGLTCKTGKVLQKGVLSLIKENFRENELPKFYEA